MMQVLRSILEYRGYRVPAEVPELRTFHVSHTSSDSRCLVYFPSDTGRAGIVVIRDISAKMETISASDAIVICDGLTSNALVEVRSLMCSNKFIYNMTPKFLMFDLFEHHEVPKHRILSEKEKSDFLKCHAVKDTKYLATLLITDPATKYLGAHPGDIVEIKRLRPNVGEHRHYRIVENPSG